MSFRPYIPFVLLLLSSPAAGQIDIAPEFKDRPPVAAPTSRISVGAIPVVLSKSEMADYFVSGLMEGLIAGDRVRGAAVVAVEGDHISIRKNFGSGFVADGPIEIGGLSEIFVVVAAMQLIEQGKLQLAADVANPLGETASRGFTVQQLLTHQAGNSALLVQLVEKLSGEPIGNYVSGHILKPLGMNATQVRAGAATTTAPDMSRLAIALLNGGAYETGRILQPATVDLMQRTSFISHGALPGRAYGFAEMRRNGWRALQHDGEAGSVDARFVLVPEAKIGYFMAANRASGGEFWHPVDNGFFDRLLVPRGQADLGLAAAPAPNAAEAETLAGSYEPAGGDAARVAPLRTQGLRLTVEARADGGLVLTGAENAELVPREGGYWSDASGNLAAVARDGQLLLSAGSYVPLAFWKRPFFYLLLALAATVAGAVADYRIRRGSSEGSSPSNALLGSTAATLLLVGVSVFVWLFAPTA